MIESGGRLTEDLQIAPAAFWRDRQAQTRARTASSHRPETQGVGKQGERRLAGKTLILFLIFFLTLPLLAKQKWPTSTFKLSNALE